MNYTTRVGLSLGDPRRPDHVAIVREPRLGETLRTKGRLYVLVEIDGRDPASRDAAQEAAEVLREEYYYDRSAGIEVSLRRAVLQANKRARQRSRGVAMHLACLVLCRNEAYAARVGSSEVFLLRRARLFVPGPVTGELTDYAYRIAAPTLPSLGADSELLVSVWREQIQPGDTFALAGAQLVDAVGADALKNAAITMHPGAAARQLHERFVSEGARGSDAVILVEVATQPSARGRAEAPAADGEADEIAERIRASVDGVWRRRPRIGRLPRAFGELVERPLATAIAFVFARLPSPGSPLPRVDEVAARRAARRQRLTGVLAVLLVFVASGILVFAYNDFLDARAGGTAAVALDRAAAEISAARAALDKKPPELSVARDRVGRAEASIGEAVATNRADVARVEALQAQVAELRQRVTAVIADLGKVEAASAPAGIDHTVHGVYVADPGAGKLWRVVLDGKTGVVAAKGQDGIGVPRLVATFGEAVYAMDDGGRLFRYEGDARREILIRSRPFRDPVAISVFAGNLYVLDRAVGQVWKYEPSADGNYSSPAIGFLTQPIPPGTGRSLAVDGDIWVTTDDGQLLRYRRPGGSLTASRLEFAVLWTGDPVVVLQVEVRDRERPVYLLDAKAGRIVEIQHDGREVRRITLPAELGAPTAFTVLEDAAVAVSLHGTRLARTDLPK